MNSCRPSMKGARRRHRFGGSTGFYRSVESLFRLWLDKGASSNTRRACRTDIKAFVEFSGITWPKGDLGLLQIAVADVVSCRDHLSSPGWLRRLSAAEFGRSRASSAFWPGVSASSDCPSRFRTPRTGTSSSAAATTRSTRPKRSR